MISKITLTFGGLFLILAIIGCSNQDVPLSHDHSKSGAITKEHLGHSHSHDDHAEPSTFRDIVEKLVDMDEQICNAFASNDTHAAHGPLHDVGQILENLTSLAKEEDIPKDVLAAVEQAKKDLFTAFGKIDKTFHGEEGSNYDEQSSKIQSALIVIKEAARVK